MTATQSKTARLGQSFDDFLNQEGVYEETEERAIKRVVAYQLAQVMKDQNITKAEMARRIATSRAQLDRLLDPEYDGVTLGTLTRAAKAVGRSLRVELV